MKKVFASIAALSLIGLLSYCNKPSNANIGTKGEAASLPATETVAHPSSGLKIAYVQMDSVLNNSQEYKDISAKLGQKAAANQATLNGKLQTIQREAEAFQQKLQSRGFVNELAAQQEQERIIKMQQDAEKQGMKLQEQFLALQQQYNDALYVSIKEEVAKLNEKLGYDLILTNVKADNLLFAREEYDITGLVIEALNARYKPEGAK